MYNMFRAAPLKRILESQTNCIQYVTNNSVESDKSLESEGK